MREHRSEKGASARLLCTPPSGCVDRPTGSWPFSEVDVTVSAREYARPHTSPRAPTTPSSEARSAVVSKSAEVSPGSPTATPLGESLGPRWVSGLQCATPLSRRSVLARPSAAALSAPSAHGSVRMSSGSCRRRGRQRGAPRVHAPTAAAAAASAGEAARQRRVSSKSAALPSNPASVSAHAATPVAYAASSLAHCRAT